MRSGVFLSAALFVIICFNGLSQDVHFKSPKDTAQLILQGLTTFFNAYGDSSGIGYCANDFFKCPAFIGKRKIISFHSNNEKYIRKLIRKHGPFIYIKITSVSFEPKCAFVGFDQVSCIHAEKTSPYGIGIGYGFGYKIDSLEMKFIFLGVIGGICPDELPSWYQDCEAGQNNSR